MPTVLLNAAVAAPVAGPGGPAEPIGPPPPAESTFASALSEAGLAVVAEFSAAGPEVPLLPLPPSGPPSPLPALPCTGESVAQPSATDPAAPPLPALAMPGATALAPSAEAPPPGWPPPGLAALFPAPRALTTPAWPAAATPALPAAVTARPAPPAAPLPLPVGRDAALSPSKASTPSMVELQPLALAAALRLPLAREQGEEALLLLPERPGTDLGEAESLSWTPSSVGGLPRLDLATAFPTPLPMHDRRFAEALGGRLQWLAEQGGGEVRLRLSPEGLGPVEIRLHLDGDRVDLAMHASLAETRQALEQALPKLREMLAQGGLQLGQADVGQHPAHEHKPGTAETPFGEAPASNTIATAASGLIVTPPRRGEGLLDLYA